MSFARAPGQGVLDVHQRDRSAIDGIDAGHGRHALPRATPVASPAVLAACDGAWERLDDCDDELVPCDVLEISEPDVAAIDALARLQLRARRRGRRIGLSGASDELRELLELMGLTEVVPCVPESGLEPVGKSEEREPARGVEEERDPGDSIA
jgi:ABC-type transporter Mla MlaB component